jgi:hypothetical protein
MKEAIVVADEPEQVTRNLADVECPLQGEAIQGLHVLEPFGKGDSAAIDQPMDKCKKDEGVVGAGGEA